MILKANRRLEVVRSAESGIAEGTIIDSTGVTPTGDIVGMVLKKVVDEMQLTVTLYGNDALNYNTNYLPPTIEIDEDSLVEVV